MDYKKDLDKWLLDLKNLNIERRKIEKELDMSEFYIDQQLSKASKSQNMAFYKKIKGYHAKMLQNATIGDRTKEDVILEMALQQMAISRVVVKGLSELLGNQPGKSVTGVQSDFERAIKEEFQKVKSELTSGS